MAIVPVGRDDRNQGKTHAVRLDGNGDVTATHRAWQRDDLGVFCASPALYKDRVYLLRNRGGLVCLDPKTGQTLWAEAFPRAASSYYASPVIANGILYAAREDGMVFAARIGEKFELLSENPMGEKIIASPTLSKDSLLLRGEKQLFCIKAE
jgi:outer membrane protein assembly factor BamB